MIFTNPGTYNLRIKAEDDCGVTSTETRTVIVKEPPYTLTFECNGGLPIAPVLVERGETYNLAPKHTEKEGWLFDGWFDNEGLTGEPITTIVMSSDKTVYAKWVDERYHTYVFNSPSNVKTLGINIPETQLSSYTNAYGNYVAAYDPWTDEEPYHFSSKNDQLWGAYRTQITRVVVGQSIKPEDLSFWFDGFTNLTTFDGGDVAKINSAWITEMKATFRDCEKLDNFDMSAWNGLNRLENISSCFQNCKSMNNWDFRYFKTDTVKDFSFAFAGVKTRNTNVGAAGMTNALILQNLTFGHAETCAYMFSGADIDYLILLRFSPSKPFPNCTNFNSMFSNITAKGIMSERFTFGSGAISDTFMFGQAYNLVGGAGTVYDVDHIQRDYAHPDGGTADPGYFRGTAVSQLTFHENGGTAVEPNPQNVISGEMITLPTPTKSGKVLEGWYTDSSLTTKAGDGFHARFDGGTHLYANWQDPQPEGTHYRFADGTLVLGVPLADLQNQVDRHGVVRNTYTNNPSASQSLFYADRNFIRNVECGSEYVLLQPSREAFMSFENLLTADVSKLVGDPNNNKQLDMAHMFLGCNSMTSANINISDDSTHITSLSSVFQGCRDLVSVVLPTNPATTRGSLEEIQRLFENCTDLTGTIDLSGIAFDNVMGADHMFNGCENITKVKFPADMNTPVIQDIHYMFTDCRALTEIENLDRLTTTNVQLFTGVFARCTSVTELDCSGFDTTNATTVSGLFQQCSNCTTIYASEKLINRPGITVTQNVFSDCRNLVGGNGTAWTSADWNDADKLWIDGYQNTAGLLTKGHNLPVAYAKYHVLDRTLTFFRDLPNAWQEGQVEDVYTYFTDIEGFSGDWEPKWPYSIGVGTQRILTDGSKFHLDGTRCMFKDFINLTECDMRDFSFDGTDMGYMFAGCEKLNTLYLGDENGSWDVSNVTTMEWMFDGCNVLPPSAITQMSRTWDTSNVTRTNRMFSNSNSFGRLDLRNFDFTAVQVAGEMFLNDDNLVGIDVNPLKCFDHNVLVVSGCQDMFKGCVALSGGWGTQYDPNYVGAERAYVDTPSTPGYFSG